MALCALFLFACQSEIDNMEQIGYLSLSVGQDLSTETKALPESYNPEQIAVQIVNGKGAVVEETDNADNWKGKTFALPVGSYTIKASSNGFDGQEAAFDAPYYAASKQVTVAHNATLNETLTCTLANVKVTVKYAPELLEAFQSVASTVSDKGNVHSLSFPKTETRSAYFPVSDLSTEITLVNKQSVTNTLKKELTGVKARDHYILNYRLAQAGNTNITVTVDPTTNTYEYTFTLGDQTQSATLSANAWSSFADLKATRLSGITADMALKFQYREKGSEAWTDATTQKTETEYSAKLTALKANTTYEYQLLADNSVIGNVAEFSTEQQVALHNGNFDTWNQNGKVWYAGTPEEASSKNSFWDSGNPGSADFEIIPTNPEESVVHTPGGKAAKLTSLKAPLVGFAAGNIFTGHFVGLDGIKGAKLDFGQPFTSRPTALHGFFQYKPGSVDVVKKTDLPIKKGDTDICSIFIALSKQGDAYHLNTAQGQLFNPNDKNIIAYGELPLSECVTSNGEWKEFTINLEYRDLESKPTHIIIVCSSSKYGDYFTGSTSSVMYLDDFELIYGDSPVVKQ